MYIYAFSAKKNVIGSIYKEESYTKHLHAINIRKCQINKNYKYSLKFNNACINFNLEWIGFYASVLRILMTNMYNKRIYLVICTSPLLLKIHGTNI